MRLKAENDYLGDDGENWVVVDEDELPGDETNYYGMVAYGFDTKEEALAYISITEHARLAIEHARRRNLN